MLLEEGEVLLEKNKLFHNGVQALAESPAPNLPLEAIACQYAAWYSSGPFDLGERKLASRCYQIVYMS